MSAAAGLSRLRAARAAMEYWVVSVPLLAVNLAYRQYSAGRLTGPVPTARDTATAQLR